MHRVFTCILCPNGCEIEAEIEEIGAKAEDGVIASIQGNLCDKGRVYVEQEVFRPKRNIASSVLVDGGELPLVSVRLTAPIPKERIFDVMAEIRKQRLAAPVQRGQVVIQDVMGLGSDVITTKHVEAVPATHDGCAPGFADRGTESVG